MNKTLSAAVVAGIALALTLTGATAANAAAPVTPPTGQTLFAIDCDDFGGQLWSVAPNGASTPVGTDDGSNDCAGGAQTSPVDGLTYFVYYNPTGTSLATINTATGVITQIAPITGDTNSAWQLVITNSGAAFVSSGQTLFSISLTTGITTAIGDVTPASIGTMGYNPVTDTIYVVNYSDTVGVFTIDRTTGAGTDTGLTGTWPTATCLDGSTDNEPFESLTFDAAGYAWLQSDACDTSIMTLDIATGDAAYRGQLYDATGTVYTGDPAEFYSETFFFGAAPVVAPVAQAALAATGSDSVALGTTAGIGAVAAVLGASLLGFALMARRRSNAS